MPLNAAERVLVLVRCDHCGKTTEKFLSGLIGKEVIRCENPACGEVVDLRSPYNAVVIKELIEYAARADAAMTEIGDQTHGGGQR